MMWREIARTVSMICVLLVAYRGVAWLMHQPMQPIIVLGLTLLALGAEALWSLLRWLGPLRGRFGTPNQESSLVRSLDRELSRALRHRAPLVMVAVMGKRGLTPRALSARLRTSDIVIRGRARHLIILMTETQMEQAQSVLERMALNLPIRAIAMLDEATVRGGLATIGFDARYRTRQNEAYGSVAAVLRGLQLGLFRARAQARPDQPAPIVVIGPGDLRDANTRSTARPLDDLTQRVA
jgi:hypothetical protein